MKYIKIGFTTIKSYTIVVRKSKYGEKTRLSWISKAMKLLPAA